jgi:L-rhamnose isomerase/sugar isomerase
LTGVLSVTELIAAFRGLVIETASPGTRFGVYERVDDAAEVHRLTGTAGSVALRFPCDAVEDYEHLRAHVERHGLRVGSVRPDGGSLTHPDADVRERAVAHLLECFAIATELGATAQWPRLDEGLRHPGEDDLRCVYRRLPAEQEVLIDLTDWGGALLTCLRLGERARVLVGPGSKQEQIVAVLAEEGRLGGVIVRAVNPFELFLVLVELTASSPLPRLIVDRADDVEATTVSVVDLQEAYAKALLVDRPALREAQEFGDALFAREILLDAFRTDVRSHCVAARAALGAAENPLVALRQSDYVERMALQRASGKVVIR